MIRPMRGKQLNLSNPWIKHLVGCWFCNEGTGKTLHDYSKYNHDGTLVMNNISGAWVAGSDGWALSFNGSADKVTFGDVDQLDDATELTVLMRVWHTNLSADHTLMAKHQGTLNGVFFFRDDVGAGSGRTDTYSITIMASSGSGNTTLEGATNASKLKTWQDVAFTFKEDVVNGLHLYVDGVEDVNSPKDTTGLVGINAGPSLLVMGAKSNNADFFAGKIDYLVIYDKVLPFENIKRIQANLAMLVED